MLLREAKQDLKNYLVDDVNSSAIARCPELWGGKWGTGGGVDAYNACTECPHEKSIER